MLLLSLGARLLYFPRISVFGLRLRYSKTNDGKMCSNRLSEGLVADEVDGLIVGVVDLANPSLLAFFSFFLLSLCRLFLSRQVMVLVTSRSVRGISPRGIPRWARAGSASLVGLMVGPNDRHYTRNR